MFEAEDKLVKAELLSSGHTALIIKLKDGTVLIGHSLGIEPYDEDDWYGTGINALSFRTLSDKKLHCLTNDKIEDVGIYTES